MIVYLNGRYVDRTRATVAVDDRGFLFGDGVYEVTRARNGRLFEAARHLRRLARGLDALAVALPPRTHHFPPAGTPPTVFLSANPLAVPDDVRARGATAITTPDLRWERCDLKTIQLLANVLAKQQAVAAGAFEAILMRDGIATEGASTNLLAVIDGAIRTHPADHRILPGVTREVVLELATELGVGASEAPFSVRELFGASELFLTGTTVDVMPVVQVDGRAIGAHRPGPVARELHAALRARLVRDTTRAPAL